MKDILVRTRALLTTAFNTTLILQSALPLLVSLAGMLVTGILFEMSVKEDRFRLHPIILEAGCILSFKGNVELSLAMHLSSLRFSSTKSSKFGSSAFFNSNATLAQSFITGFLAGSVGVVSSLIGDSGNSTVYAKIVVAAALTCFVTSLVFILVLLATIELARFFDVCTENFILPVLSTVNDFIVVKGLLVSTDLLEHYTLKQTVLVGFGILCLFGISLFFTLRAKSLIPFHAIEVLSASYLLSILSGYLLEKYSSAFPAIASAFPVFAGMCGSISFIYIHRRFKLFQDQVPERQSQHLSLFLISLIVSLFYIALSKVFRLNYSTSFCVMFVIMFSCQVMLLIVIIENVLEKMRDENKNISISALPIVAAVSDFIAVIILIASTLALKWIVDK